MPETRIIAINTSPLIALVAALGDLRLLQDLYDEVWVSREVCQEIARGGSSGFAIAQFEQATWLNKCQTPQQIPPLLLNSLDLGEASVIQLALERQIQTVCIDEVVGRRIARLSGLSVTGSIGILLKAKQYYPQLSIREAIAKMLNHNIRLSQTVIDFALQQAGENA